MSSSTKKRLLNTSGCAHNAGKSLVTSTQDNEKHQLLLMKCKVCEKTFSGKAYVALHLKRKYKTIAMGRKFYQIAETTEFSVDEKIICRLWTRWAFAANKQDPKRHLQPWPTLLCRRVSSGKLIRGVSRCRFFPCCFLKTTAGFFL